MHQYYQNIVEHLQIFESLQCISYKMYVVSLNESAKWHQAATPTICLQCRKTIWRYGVLGAHHETKWPKCRKLSMSRRRVCSSSKICLYDQDVSILLAWGVLHRCIWLESYWNSPRNMTLGKISCWRQSHDLNVIRLPPEMLHERTLKAESSQKYQQNDCFLGVCWRASKVIRNV